MATVVLLSEEVEELRKFGEPHDECPTSGTYRLVAVLTNAAGEVIATDDASPESYLHHRLICDGCGGWGCRIEDRGPASAEWNQPARK